MARVRLAAATRAHPDAVLGLSPRGGVALQRCAQATALIWSRTFVTPDDVKSVAPAAMAHPMLARDRRSDTARAVVEQGLKDVPVPVE